MRLQSCINGAGSQQRRTSVRSARHTGRCNLFVSTQRLGGALPNAYEKYRGAPFHIGQPAAPEHKRTLAETVQFRRAGLPFAETASDLVTRRAGAQFVSSREQLPSAGTHRHLDYCGATLILGTLYRLREGNRAVRNDMALPVHGHDVVTVIEHDHVHRSCEISLQPE